MQIIRHAVSILILLVVGVPAWADKREEILKQAKSIEQEATKLFEQGYKEEAAKLKRKAMGMVEMAKTFGGDKANVSQAELKKMKQLMLQKGKSLTGNKSSQSPASSKKATETSKSPHSELAQRLEHMKIAVDHLHQAGLHDFAEQIIQRAKLAQREIEHRDMPKHVRPEADALQEVMRQLDELRKEVGRLGKAVGEMREKQ